MAYQIIRHRENEEQAGSEVTILLDSAAELANIGTNWAPGSFAVIADTGMPTYVLNASKEWKAV